jgi:hypothetical protein
MFMPASNTLFCICYKCGTTSLYHYLFAATHQQTWCEFYHQHLDPSHGHGGGLGCAEGATTTALLAASSREGIPLRQQKVDEEAGLLPRTFSADLPGGEAERELLRSLVGIGAMEREPEQEAHLTDAVDALGAHNMTLDMSENPQAKWWGDTFRHGAFPRSMWQDHKIYTHAIIREPVERLLSAYVNKLSCGLYSVPAGQRGDSKGNQKLWGHVVEPGGSVSYGKNVLAAAAMGADKLQTLTFQAPCNTGGLGGMGARAESAAKEKSCEQTNFTQATCEGMTLHTFADAISEVYRVWFSKDTWDPIPHPYTTLNVHFTPQAGSRSCFQSVAPEDYDTVSTISDGEAMRTFSSHLATSMHGLWSNEHANSASSSNLYFEGKPWQVPASVIRKLTEATKVERELLAKFLQKRS